MHKVSLFGEDFGHEEVLKALLRKISRNLRIAIDVDSKSVRGGYSKVKVELKQYLRDLKSGRLTIPDVIVVATDANCLGFIERKNELDGAILPDFKELIVYAIPDPHVERWLLLDSKAFKMVLGEGCDAPGQKCKKDLYKRLLRQAIQKTGTSPLLGGIEFAQDIIDAMDFETAQSDNSFNCFIRDIRAKLKQLVNR